MLTAYQIGLMIGQNEQLRAEFWKEENSSRFPFNRKMLRNGYSNNDLQYGVLDGEFLFDVNEPFES